MFNDVGVIAATRTNESGEIEQGFRVFIAGGLGANKREGARLVGHHAATHEHGRQGAARAYREHARSRQPGLPQHLSQGRDGDQLPLGVLGDHPRRVGGNV